MPTPRRLLERLAKFFHLESWIRLLMLCVVVGIAAGLVGVLFDRGLYYLYDYLFLDGLNKQETGSLLSLVLILGAPCFCHFLAGAIAIKWAPEVGGGGTDEVIHAFHKGKGVIRPVVPWLKGLCTILTIGSGGSAGKEGPTAQIGAGVGSFIGGTFGLSIRDRRILMLAGCAGGLGAVLRAPLGGALFAAEMLYREPDFEHDAVIPGVICSVTAYSVFTAILGQGHALQFPSMGMFGNWTPSYPSDGGNMVGELLHYALLSVCCAIVALLMVRGIRLIKETVARRLPIPGLMKPALGGLALGILTAFMMVTYHMAPSDLMGEGRILVRQIIGDALGVSTREPSYVSFGITMLVVVLLCRILATGLTVGCGASGGLLFPILLVGGLTGAAYGKFTNSLPLPESLALTPGARAGMIVVAMGGVFSGSTKTPIASLVLISEMSGSYGLVVPLMLCCASTYLLTTSFSVEEAQVANIADSPAHRGDFLINVLEDIRVKDALTGRVKPDPIPADMPYHKVLEKIKHSTASTFPIVDEDGYLVGIFSLGDLRHIMNEQAVGSLVVAGDLGTSNVPTVTLETRLSDALTLFTQKSIDELPVVEELTSASRLVDRTSRRNKPRGTVGTRRVVAMLTRHDLIAAYRQRLSELQSQDDKESSGTSVFESALESTPEMEGQLAAIVEETGIESVTNPPPRDASQVEEDLLEDPKEDPRSKNPALESDNLQ
ncbi:MAG: chloride channel protein [Planctomycetes bacterium]|nr:chloride channel protein [Planctomycetota bacterium]